MKYTSELTTNSRVIKELLTKYRDTFVAFCELINNSIQALATTIDINITYTNDLTNKSPITKIEMRDNGWGVSITDFEKKIFDIGTDVKLNGQGIGRFSALQIGEKMTIDTVAFDKDKKQFTRVVFFFRC